MASRSHRGWCLLEVPCIEMRLEECCAGNKVDQSKEYPLG
ncbi:hypothetical protein COLO4_06826 [Corchorus olitorius]|uniref:Uncharacterized protein n=1 Tax=Corchorus olitorius TaxID=93759 RepID=A0A1R3KLT3_9ROSI|nr:hypothetical protein COLO4_06826 [Corchorus olitorius]